jgi:hypothetical protein
MAESKLPTDPLADASTGVRRRSRGAFMKTVPEVPRERRDSRRASTYTGPERRHTVQGPPPAETPAPQLFGFPRWMVFAAIGYVVALAIALVLVFSY